MNQGIIAKLKAHKALNAGNKEIDAHQDSSSRRGRGQKVSNQYRIAKGNTSGEAATPKDKVTPHKNARQGD